MQVQLTNNRLILGDEFDTIRRDKTFAGVKFKQAEGISHLTGFNATIQKKLGLAEDITIEGKTYTINKKSRNKWLARTTQNTELKTVGHFSKTHDIITKAISDYQAGTAEILENHVQAKAKFTATERKFQSVEDITTLLDDEARDAETASSLSGGSRKESQGLEGFLVVDPVEPVVAEPVADDTAIKGFLAELTEEVVGEVESQRLARLQEAVRPQDIHKPVADDTAIKGFLAEVTEAAVNDVENQRLAGLQVAVRPQDMHKPVAEPKVAKPKAKKAKPQPVELPVAAPQKAWVGPSFYDVATGKAKSPATKAKEARARFKKAAHSVRLLAKGSKAFVETREEAIARTPKAKLAAAQSEFEAAKEKLTKVQAFKPSMAEVLVGTQTPTRNIREAEAELSKAGQKLSRAEMVVLANTPAWQGVSGADIIANKAMGPKAAQAFLAGETLHQELANKAHLKAIQGFDEMKRRTMRYVSGQVKPKNGFEYTAEEKAALKHQMHKGILRTAVKGELLDKKRSVLNEQKGISKLNKKLAKKREAELAPIKQEQATYMQEKAARREEVLTYFRGVVNYVKACNKYHNDMVGYWQQTVAAVVAENKRNPKLPPLSAKRVAEIKASQQLTENRPHRARASRKHWLI